MATTSRYLFCSLQCSTPLPKYLTLPYLRGGQVVVTPAQRWGRISSAQCATPDVTRRSQWSAVKPKSAAKPNKSPATWDWWRVVWLFLSGGLHLV